MVACDALHAARGEHSQRRVGVARAVEQIANAQNILELAQTAAGGLTEAEYSAFEGLSAARRACAGVMARPRP